MVVDRLYGTIEHRWVRELPDFLRPNDCLIRNDSRVVPAKLSGVRTSTGGKWEGLFLSQLTAREWTLIGQTRGRLLPGELLTIRHPRCPNDELFLTLQERLEGGTWRALVTALANASPWDLLQQFGDVPLPPYIGEDANRLSPDEERVRYQTIYADRPGSVAAPTAGLHFSPELEMECRAKGVTVAHVTLHVGMGTFRPVASEDLSQHVMHKEWCELSVDTANAMAAAALRGGRIAAVGTTSLRTLEAAYRRTGDRYRPWTGDTDLFLRPPDTVHAADALLTNFHLPKSTLLMLVSTFAGYDLIREAYRQAVARQYRFFSYGDAMLIL